MRIWFHLAIVLSAALPLLSGCRDQASTDAGSAAKADASAGGNSASSAVAAEIGGQLSDLINEATERYRPLKYEYNEGLLTILDRVENRLSGKTDKLDPRPMPKLDEAEELDHLRESVRRWEAKSGKKLRAALDPLLVDVAARKPGGPAFHPDFQKKFAATFDDFIPIEVAEIQERRNRYIHEKAKPILERYRAEHPDAVKAQEAVLNTSPYNLPAPSKSSG